MLNRLQRLRRWLEYQTEHSKIPTVGAINIKTFIALFLLLIVSAAAAAEAPVVAAVSAVLPAPFNIGWLPTWVVSTLSGVITAFYKIEAIDDRLYIPFIAKPVIATISGVIAVAAMIDDSLVPLPVPTIGHLPYAFFAGLMSAIVIGGAMIYISNQKRFNKLMDAAIEHVPLLKSSKGGDDDSNSAD